MHQCNKESTLHYLMKNIFTTFKIMTMNFMKHLYTCYVGPVLESATQVGSPIQKGNIDRIESVERYFTRHVIGLGNLSYENTLAWLDRLNLESLESRDSRRIKLDLMLFFKVCNGFVNMDVSDSYRFKEVYRGHNRNLHVNYANR